ncbi:hypothetical protein B0T26DRAFT_683073 [Lasiosphaeria miniovina]|uniref:Uncharacterized protein n=1 Tax=Lasiosphaeria miniovina TaxID=1954250 RepID=A0AA40EFB9_9PEZI|nr:uncharacterized protein B0T26DRAFT_683073 [Lasiosphaeria miniovina]KAK0733188.1 hypothetical protein B0T26DRAFT_683073 [Lasiosphaeria miniovina]
MIERAQRLRDVFDYWCFQSSHEADPAKVVPADDVLTPEDWPVLKEITTQLEPLKVVTNRFEAQGPLICEVIPTMYHLVDEFSNRRRTFAPAQAYLCTCPPRSRWQSRPSRSRTKLSLRCPQHQGEYKGRSECPHTFKITKLLPLAVPAEQPAAGNLDRANDYLTGHDYYDPPGATQWTRASGIPSGTCQAC